MSVMMEGPTAPPVLQARFSDDSTHIIDSDGNLVPLTDPRVVLVWTIDCSPYVQRLIVSFMRHHGIRCRVSADTGKATLEYAKRISSGRECIAFRSIAGSIIRDLAESRNPDEITIYYNHDQHGPCQNGAWPEIWRMYQHAINLRNVVLFSNFNFRNNYWGLGDELGNELMTAIVFGDCFDEAEGVLRCIAKDAGAALDEFNRAIDTVVDAAAGGIAPAFKAFKEWSKRMAAIPLSAGLDETPRVLIFGGLNTRLVHHPITTYFIEIGVIPKIVDFGEITIANESEPALRYNYMRGRVRARDYMRFGPVLLDFLRPSSDRRAVWEALRARLAVTLIEKMVRRYRRVAHTSGLIHDPHIPHEEVVYAGDRLVTSISYAETVLIAGRYVKTIESGAYDGLVQVGVFGCPPTINAHAVLRPLANKSEVPYVALDVEGPWISANQTVLLESLAVQARRERARKIAARTTRPSGR